MEEKSIWKLGFAKNVIDRKQDMERGGDEVNPSSHST